jgi:hypothetical protein
MIKHKPIPQTNISIGKGQDKIEYKCHRATGIVELPIRLEWANPIEEEELVKEKPKKRTKKVKDEE